MRSEKDLCFKRPCIYSRISLREEVLLKGKYLAEKRAEIFRISPDLKALPPFLFFPDDLLSIVGERHCIEAIYGSANADVNSNFGFLQEKVLRLRFQCFGYYTFAWTLILKNILDTFSKLSMLIFMGTVICFISVQLMNGIG